MTPESPRADVEPNVVQRIVNAWDCCGTCAGGVLAQWLTQRDTETAAQALREAADALIAEQPEDRTTVAHAKVDAARWLRARADSLATEDAD